MNIGLCTTREARAAKHAGIVRQLPRKRVARKKAEKSYIAAAYLF
jgi:hypothetical protein